MDIVLLLFKNKSHEKNTFIYIIFMHNMRKYRNSNPIS